MKQENMGKKVLANYHIYITIWIVKQSFTINYFSKFSIALLDFESNNSKEILPSVIESNLTK